MTFIRDCTDNACHTLRSCPSLCGAARPVREDEPCFGPTRNKAPTLSEGNRGSAVHVRGISATDEGPDPKSSSQYVESSSRRASQNREFHPGCCDTQSLHLPSAQSSIEPRSGLHSTVNQSLLVSNSVRGLKMSSSMAPGAGSAGSIEICVGSKI